MQNRGITKENKTMAIKFRDLRADEVECRIGTVVKDKGVSLLLYKDARCDMNILDETVGAENWQREHYECKGNLFCKVGINTNYADETKADRWIWKADCGKESYTESEKGESSDSFKRACTNWSLGRELYTSPFIWIKWGNCDIDAKGKPKNNFKVSHMVITDKKITELEIVNPKGVTVFAMGAKGNNVCKTGKSTKVRAIESLAEKKGVNPELLLKKYKVKSLEDLTEEQTDNCFTGLSGMKDKV